MAAVKELGSKHVSDSVEHGRRLNCLMNVDGYPKKAIDILGYQGISGE